MGGHIPTFASGGNGSDLSELQERAAGEGSSQSQLRPAKPVPHLPKTLLHRAPRHRSKTQKRRAERVVALGVATVIGLTSDDPLSIFAIPLLAFGVIVVVGILLVFSVIAQGVKNLREPVE